MKYRTWTPHKDDLQAAGGWYLVDATGMALGRLASNVAAILRGKHKPTYTPHQNMGDHVVIINAEKVVVTGAKLDDKEYIRYSGYPSGLKRRTLRQQQALDPTVPVRHAVEGMLQRNRLGASMLKRLRVYPGPDHGQQAQQPKPIAFNRKGDIEDG
jgi:large subunit ribosomal protein L13